MRAYKNGNGSEWHMHAKHVHAVHLHVRTMIALVLSLLVQGTSVLLCAHKQASPEVILSVGTRRTVQSALITAGEQVTVEVRIVGLRADQQWPAVPGLKQEYIIGRRKTNELSVMNGVQQSAQSFVFDVVFPYPGTASLGPVTVVDEAGQRYRSNALECTIVAGDAAGTNNAPTHTKNQFSAFFTWEIPAEYHNTVLYEGQRVPVALILYSSDRSITIEGLSTLQVDAGTISLAQEPTWDTASHNGRPYARCIWSGFFSADKPGEFWLPAMAIAFARSDPTPVGSQSPWHMMQRMMQGFAGEQRRAPARKCDIQPLPSRPSAYKDIPFIGVGAIDAIEWTVSQPTVEVGAAVVAMRTIRGTSSSNTDRLPAPRADCHVQIYPSTVMSHGVYPRCVREEQWIVQGLEAGLSTIEQQDFLMFNPLRHAYETVTSSALSLECVPSAAMPVDIPPVVDERLPSVESSLAPDTGDVPIVEDGAEPLPSLLLFLSWLLFPVMFVVLRKPLLWLFSVGRRWWELYYAAKKIRMQLHGLSTGDVYVVRLWIVHYIDIVCNQQCSVDAIPGVIADLFCCYGMGADEIDQWYIFWRDITRAAFAGSSLEDSSPDTVLLLERSRYWVDRIIRFSWRSVCRL